jgi:hypothetical protein
MLLLSLAFHESVNAQNRANTKADSVDEMVKVIKSETT